MFEHQLVLQQLREAIQEKNDVMHHYIQVQQDINSLVKLVNNRLYKEFNIPPNIFTSQANKEADFDHDGGCFDKCGSPADKDSIYQNDVNEVKVNKNLYLNSSNLPSIDSLAKELFKLFDGIQRYTAKVDDLDDSFSFELENRDKVGYILSPGEYDFAIPKTKGKAIPDQIKYQKSKTSLGVPPEKSKTTQTQA